MTTPPSLPNKKFSSCQNICEELPPPLPRRKKIEQNEKDTCSKERSHSMKDRDRNSTRKDSSSRNGIQSGQHKVYCPRAKPGDACYVDNSLYFDKNIPPPLPPRNPPRNSGDSEADAANSINKQMTYPLVATCATLVNDYVSKKHFLRRI